MPNDEKSLKVDATKDLAVDFQTDFVVATWWVHLVVGEQAVRTWTGTTADAAQDKAIIPAADLKGDRKVVWQLVLFGSIMAPIPYSIRVLYSQADKEIARDKESGTIEVKKTALLSATHDIEVAP